MENQSKSIFDVINDYLKTTVWNNIPSDQIIYHYTNCAALVSIIKDHLFWLSSIELMNDKVEVDYSIDIVSKVISGIDFPDHIKNELLNNFRKSKKTSAINTFALSFSLDKDSLNLWNNYAKGDGYNMGFQLSKILELLKTNIHILNGENILLVNGKVIYNEDIQIGLLTILFKKYYELYLLKKKDGILKTENDNDVSKIWKMIHLYSSMIKSDHHSIENEYRFILTLPDNSNAVKFRSRNGVILPYVEMKIENDFGLNEITIGPKIDDTIAKEALDYFIEKTNNQSIKIDKSSIKIRF